ncbi:MAG: glycosyltransferase family 4 protein [Candidatus Levybacteria bacterium]|nr:glycosyltransferase family 4 protein [Candidatus Levybacteria bacterium]
MNILILNWRDPKNPKSGGAEIVTHEHAKAWVRMGHKVVWFSSRYPNSMPSEKIDGIRVIRSGGPFLTYLIAPFYYVSNRKSFDIVIDEIHGIPYFTPLYVRKPKVAFIHEVADDIWDYMYPFPINKVGRFVESFYFKLYKNISFWTVSESTEKDLRKLGIKKISLIHNGISFPIQKVDKEKYPTFIFVSRLVKMKGVEDVLEAFSNILSKIGKSKLWVVGVGEADYMASLQKKVMQLGIKDNVEFFGRVTEDRKYELLGRSHLILHASVKEGWGLVVIEAASQKTPAVVYNVPGLKDSVKNNITGIIAAKNTPESLANAVIELLNDKKKYSILQKNAYNFARSLTWSDATTKSISLLESL